MAARQLGMRVRGDGAFAVAGVAVSAVAADVFRRGQAGAFWDIRDMGGSDAPWIRETMDSAGGGCGVGIADGAEPGLAGGRGEIVRMERRAGEFIGDWAGLAGGGPGRAGLQPAAGPIGEDGGIFAQGFGGVSQIGPEGIAQNLEAAHHGFRIGLRGGGNDGLGFGREGRAGGGFGFSAEGRGDGVFD